MLCVQHELHQHETQIGWRYNQASYEQSLIPHAVQRPDQDIERHACIIRATQKPYDELSNEKSFGCLGHVRDDRTQVCRDYNEPVEGSL